MNATLHHKIRASIFLCLWLAPLSYANVCTLNIAPDSCLKAQEPQSVCAQRIAEDPFDLSAQLSLCEVFLQANDPTRAMSSLQQGLDVCSGRKTVCNRLRLALSNVDEKRRAQNRSDPAEARRAADALRGYCEGPIANERSIVACQNLLLSYPKDPLLTAALAKKLLKSGDPSKALIYLYKIKRSQRSQTLNDQIQDASRQRRVVLNECLNDNSLPKCNLALLPGAKDEHSIHRQRAKLLASKRLYQQALRAYLTAVSIKPEDTQTALGLVQLQPDRFNSSGLKLQLFRAQAQAWRLLKDPEQEREALQQILSLRSADAAASARLATLAGPDANQGGIAQVQASNEAPTLASTAQQVRPELETQIQVQEQQPSPAPAATTPVATTPVATTPTATTQAPGKPLASTAVASAAVPNAIHSTGQSY